MTEDESRLARGVRELLSGTVRDLEAGQAPLEALAVLTPARKRMGINRPAVMRPAGRAWRLGVLLLDPEGRLYATGKVTRAIVPKRGVTNRSHEADLRRADQRTAARGPFAEGEVVNFGFAPVALDEESLRAGTGVLFLSDDTVMMRLDAGRGASKLDAYLAERVRLITSDWPD